MNIHCNVSERFFKKVVVTDGCWTWTGSITKNGYGSFHYNKKTVTAHRMSFFIKNGYFPDLLVCHKCDVRNCVNPDHFFLGTYKDNNRDAIKKNRQTFVIQNIRRNKTNCNRGHEFSLENTYLLKGKHRRCKTCLKINKDKYHGRN